MPSQESSEAVSADQAWSDLRHHLEWTRHEPTVVFIAAQSRDQSDDLRNRTALWCRRNREQWTPREAEGSADWLRRKLPMPGVLWLDLWAEERYLAENLHVLNELRIRLSCPGGGCLVVCGPVSLLRETAREAADLWSVRSFAHIVRTALPPLVPARPAVDSANWQELAGGEKYSPTWRLTVPEQLRTPEASAALQEVSRSRFLLPADPAGARQVLDEARVGKSLVQRIVFGLTRAEVSGLLGDGVGVEANLASVVSVLQELPRGFRVDVSGVVRQIGEAFGAYNAAAEAARDSLRVARELVELLGTPESRRDLSVSLDNVGRVAERRGDLGEAADCFQESLGARRELVELLGTPESRRDLSVSLNNVGSVAELRGDLGEAADCFQESLGVARALADEQGTLQALKDLLVVLKHRARIADKAGDTALAGQLTDEARRLDAVVTGGS